MPKPIFAQLPGKVVSAAGFKHVFALNIDQTGKKGLLRCITSRSGGDIVFAGTIDKSELYIVKGKPHRYKATRPLILKNGDKILKKLANKADTLLGLEDPDIYKDAESGKTHVYFTFPVKKNNKTLIHLGHAKGDNLEHLTMTKPVLASRAAYGAKEVTIMPQNSHGLRLNLVESSDKIANTHYSTIRIAIAKDLGLPWKYGPTVLHPKNQNISWIAGHVSPGPLVPREFIDLGPGKILCLLNGRSKNTVLKGGKIKYGPFKVGLCIYDYEKGQIDWVSPDPLIFDSQARTITFASQFLIDKNNLGIVYAHVDDSFVRAYRISISDLKQYLLKYKQISD